MDDGSACTFAIARTISGETDKIKTYKFECKKYATQDEAESNVYITTITVTDLVRSGPKVMAYIKLKSCETLEMLEVLDPERKLENLQYKVNCCTNYLIIFTFI